MTAECLLKKGLNIIIVAKSVIRVFFDNARQRGKQLVKGVGDSGSQRIKTIAVYLPYQRVGFALLALFVVGRYEFFVITFPGIGDNFHVVSGVTFKLVSFGHY